MNIKFVSRVEVDREFTTSEVQTLFDFCLGEMSRLDIKDYLNGGTYSGHLLNAMEEYLG